MTSDDAVSLMQEFSNAWNAHDIDALIRLVTSDCVFDTAAGPTSSGSRHVGHAALRVAFSAIWEAMPDAEWADATHVAFGDRGFSEWTFRGTRKSDGVRVEARGIDVFRFQDGRIAHKDTFRKSITT